MPVAGRDATAITCFNAGVRPRLLQSLSVVACVVLLAGCGVSEDQPRPNLAAEVGGERLGVSDLDLLVDAVCTSAEADETAATTTRRQAQDQLLQSWISFQAVLAAAESDGSAVDGPEAPAEDVPGWETMTEDEQKAVQTYLRLGSDARASAERLGESAGGENVDVTVNPRYGLDASDVDLATVLGSGLPAGDEQLSVAVSDEARQGEAGPDETGPAELAALPSGQLCGPRPETATG